MNSNRKDKRIFLTGFMGSGKSTIGPILANTLGYSFIDVDGSIEKSAGQTVNQIFREKGEEHFRRMEAKLLSELCGAEDIVVALGGGTIANPSTMAMVTAAGVLVYLKTSPERLFYRLQNKTNRPLLFDSRGERLDPASLKSRVMELYRFREAFYEKADITVLSGERPVGLTVDEIVRKLSRRHA